MYSGPLRSVNTHSGLRKAALAAEDLDVSPGEVGLRSRLVFASFPTLDFSLASVPCAEG